MTNTIPEDIDLPFRVDSLSSWTTTIRRELMERDDPSHPSGSRIKCTRVLPGSFPGMFGKPLLSLLLDKRLGPLNVFI